MNKLNGWQRVWIVTALVWAAVVVFFGSITSPDSPARIRELRNEEWVDQCYQRGHISKDELRRHMAEDELLAKVRKGHLDTVLPIEVGDAIDAKYDGLIRQYPHDLAIHVVHSAAVWAFPLIAIYLLGMGVAWIRAGFRTRKLI
jgi:hypothetical protein